jgi:hypothetical protein
MPADAISTMGRYPGLSPRVDADNDRDRAGHNGIHLILARIPAGESPGAAITLPERDLNGTTSVGSVNQRTRHETTTKTLLAILAGRATRSVRYVCQPLLGNHVATVETVVAT